MNNSGITQKVESDNGKVSVYLYRFRKVMDGNSVLADEQFEIYGYDHTNPEPRYFGKDSNTGISEILIDLFVWLETCESKVTSSSFMKELKDAIAKLR